MAASTSSLLLPDLAVLSLQTTPTAKKRSLRPYKLPISSNKVRFSLRPRNFRVRASTKGESVAIEERERELLKKVNGNGAVSGAGSGEYGINGMFSSTNVEKYTNGGLSNGSLVKYANGNGVATAEILEREEREEEVLSEDGRKKRIEDIGKEDAWFKNAGQVEV